DRAARVLHTLRCVGFTNAHRIAAAAGLPVGDVMPALSDLVERGLVTEEFWSFGGWGIPTGAGRGTTSGWRRSRMRSVPGRWCATATRRSCLSTPSSWRRALPGR